MLSIDTNLLFHALAQDRPEHNAAKTWLSTLIHREDVAISEFVLVEFYRLLRNPAVVAHPLSAEEAVAVVSHYRRHPKWKLLGYCSASQEVHDLLYQYMARPGMAYRRIYDARLALTLRQHGVTEFATTNVKDFEGFGFSRIWNPLEPSGTSER